jgi:hypothetical protein
VGAGIPRQEAGCASSIPLEPSAPPFSTSIHRHPTSWTGRAGHENIWFHAKEPRRWRCRCRRGAVRPESDDHGWRGPAPSCRTCIWAPSSADALSAGRRARRLLRLRERKPRRRSLATDAQEQLPEPDARYANRSATAWPRWNQLPGARCAVKARWLGFRRLAARGRARMRWLRRSPAP